MAVGEVELRRVNLLSDLFPERTAVESEETVLPESDPVTVQTEERAAFVTECPEGVTCIEDYADSLAEGMEPFYRKLAEAGSVGTPVRIAYFGDSFIEGDIFTADLRDLLQSRFGGCGVGFVDIASVTSGFRQSVRATSRNFHIHSITDSIFNRTYMGVNERYFTTGAGSASVTLSGTRYGNCTGRASRSSVYFLTTGPLQVSARVNDDDRRVYSFSGKTVLQHATVEGDIRKVAWTVERDSLMSPAYFYGTTMDCDTGIILDNFSLRGSSGQTLASIPRGHLEEFARLRPYDLIVLHFGLNVAHAKSAALRYKGYVMQMQKVIRLFREVYPQASLLIVSVSDRDARNEKGEITTMNGIRSLVTAQQNLARESGTAFWNLFQAMGGEGSMKELAEKQPPMANKDYTHLNFRGGRFLAQKFYDALMAGVANYERKMNYEKN